MDTTGVSSLERCPYSQRLIVHKSTIGTSETVLIRDVCLFSEVD